MYHGKNLHIAPFILKSVSVVHSPFWPPHLYFSAWLLTEEKFVDDLYCIFHDEKETKTKLKVTFGNENYDELY